jgi:hypothetical protein
LRRSVAPLSVVWQQKTRAFGNLLAEGMLSESKPRQVLVLPVEDETFIRIMIADMVEELGHYRRPRELSPQSRERQTGKAESDEGTSSGL